MMMGDRSGREGTLFCAAMDSRAGGGAWGVRAGV